MLATLERAFWAIVEAQAKRRGRENVTAFGAEVAKTVLSAGLLAVEDRGLGHPQYRVVSAPTGSGKSTYAWALVAALVEADSRSSVVFLCETIDQCEDTYKELSGLVRPEDLAIWTGAHDRSKDIAEIEQTYGFRPCTRFHVKDLDSRRVVVVTHAFHKGRRGAHARTYTGEPRTLTIVDERPKEVSIFDIDQGDVSKVRDWATLKFGNDSAAESALKALHGYLGDVWEMERVTGMNFRALARPDLSWFISPEAAEAAEEQSDSLHSRVICFAQSLVAGYAFMSRYEGVARGGRFVGYRMDLPIAPGTILLDATSDIDGVSQIVPWRRTVKSPRVSFENLTVTHIAPPSDIISSRETVTEIVKKAKRASPYAKWIKETVVANTDVGEKVLVVTHKAMIDHAYLPDIDSLEDLDAYDLEGRKVAFINWGRGVGSNRWKEATSVFLFGEFHVPKRATVGTALGLLDQPAGVPQLNKMQSPNTRDKVFVTLHQGHLLRWEKQLAMRGNARNLTDDGVCGHQKLFVTSEFRRFVQFRDLLFPGATFNVDESSRRMAVQKGGSHAIAAFLLTHTGEEFTSTELSEATGTRLKDLSRTLSAALVREAMGKGEWLYVPGRGRTPSRFVRRPFAVAAE